MTTPACQPALGSLPANAIFLTLMLPDDAAALAAFRGFCDDLPGLVRAVGFRTPEVGLSCVIGIGHDLWQRLGTGAMPAGLHPFAQIAGVHRAQATPGDILLHIRAARPDFCCELARQIMARLGPWATVVDDTPGFKLFDNRDLPGFVDGPESPKGEARTAAVPIGAEDSAIAGGSHVVVQKYLRDMAKWQAMTTEAPEHQIGRHKLSEIELPVAQTAGFAHNGLISMADSDGAAVQIRRDDMAFGSPARGAFGTCFIGSARESGPTGTMLHNRFVGQPPGNHDRILDVSRAVTGGLFFVPLPTTLAQVAAGAPQGEA